MANETEYRISVDINHNQKTRATSPSQNRGNKGNNVSSILQSLTGKNMALGAIAGTAISYGKTFIDLQFGKAEKTNQMQRLNAALNPIRTFGAYPKRVMEYNVKLEKLELRYDYTNQKYRQDVNGGSRWGDVR